MDVVGDVLATTSLVLDVSADAEMDISALGEASSAGGGEGGVVSREQLPNRRAAMRTPVALAILERFLIFQRTQYKIGTRGTVSPGVISSLLRSFLQPASWLPFLP